MLPNTTTIVRIISGRDAQVIRFLKGVVFNSRPPRKMLTLDWDLPLVQQVLSAAPFELLKSVLKLVTFKFCFLLALTTARRVSDVSKLALGDHYRVQKGRVTFLPTTLAKAKDPSSFQQEVVIKSEGIATVPSRSLEVVPEEDRNSQRGGW